MSDGFNQLTFDDLSSVVLETAPVSATFPAPAHRLHDAETSVAAAHDAKRGASDGRVLALLTLYRNPAGLTDFELSAITGWQQTSIGKRRGECVAAGLVEAATMNDGTRGPQLIKRPAPSGSASIVWIINMNGRDWLRQNGYIE